MSITVRTSEGRIVLNDADANEVCKTDSLAALYKERHDLEEQNLKNYERLITMDKSHGAYEMLKENSELKLKRLEDIDECLEYFEKKIKGKFPRIDNMVARMRYFRRNDVAHLTFKDYLKHVGLR